MRSGIFLIFALAVVDAAAPASAAMLTPEACERVLGEAAVTGAEYVPGRDARGRQVRRADLNPAPISLPEALTVDIGLEDDAVLPTRPANIDLGLWLATVTLADGSVAPDDICRRLYPPPQ